MVINGVNHPLEWIEEGYAGGINEGRIGSRKEVGPRESETVDENEESTTKESSVDVEDQKDGEGSVPAIFHSEETSVGSNKNG